MAGRSELQKSEMKPSPISEAAISVAIALTTTVAVFVSTLFGFEQSYGWFIGIGLAALTTIAAIAMLLGTRKLWRIKLSDCA